MITDRFSTLIGNDLIFIIITVDLMMPNGPFRLCEAMQELSFRFLFSMISKTNRSSVVDIKKIFSSPSMIVWAGLHKLLKAL